MVLGVMGIPLLVSMIQSDRERLHRLSTEKQEIASDDGKIKVTVSGMWTKLPELNKQATLQVGYKSKEMYLIVFTDAKAAVGDLTLEKHHQITRDRMLQKMTDASATEPVSLDDGDHFQQILAWTLKSRWQQQNKLLREITGTFRSEK